MIFSVSGRSGTVERHEVRLPQQLRKPYALRPLSRRVLGLEPRAVGQHLHAERLRPLPKRLPDAAETDDAQLLAGKPGHGRPKLHAAPSRLLRHSDVLDDPPVPGQQQRHSVVRDLLHAVVRHVRDDDAQLRRGVHRDVVHSDPVPAHHDALLRRPYHPLRRLRPASQDAVHVPRQLGQRILVAVRSHHQLCANPRQHRSLRIQRRPSIVGHEHFLGHGIPRQRNVGIKSSSLRPYTASPGNRGRCRRRRGLGPSSLSWRPLLPNDADQASSSGRPTLAPCPGV